MSIPQHPETVIVKNKYYPSGLTESDIYTHYMKYKPQILNETRNRDIMFFIKVDDKFIVKRKGSDGKFIRLTPNNYDELITGRTVSLHSAMNFYENFGILDIDIDPRDNFNIARKATIDVYDYVMDKMPLVRSATVRFTGKTSFHIKCNFAKNIKIDVIKHLLESFLVNSPLAKNYNIGKQRTKGVPNIDLDRNCWKCNFITLHALSVTGLQCVDVPYNKLSSFDPNMARIKK